jgi:hypothetical protein
LEEEVGVAMKEGRNRLEFKPPYEAIGNLAGAFNRLLMTKPKEITTSPGDLQDTTGLDMVAEGSPTSDLSELNGISAPWCVVDRGEYIITHCNRAFRDLKGARSAERGTHVVEAFDRPEIVKGISQLIENQDQTDSIIEDGNGSLRIRKITIAGEKEEVALVFEEALNE